MTRARAMLAALLGALLVLAVPVAAGPDYTAPTVAAGLLNAANVAITGGSITGITDLAVADGGTGASTAIAAHRNLVEGTQAIDDSGGAIAWDVSAGRWFTVTLDGNHTFSNPTNLQTGQIYGGRACQDATGQRSPTWGSTYDGAGQIFRSASTCTALLWLYDGTKLRAISPIVTSSFHYANSAADTNQAAGEVEWLGTTGRRPVISLLGATEYRATAEVRTIGHTTAVIGWQCSLDSSTWAWCGGTAAGSGPAAGEGASIAAQGPAAGSWIAISSTYKVATVAVRPVTFGGNATADPVHTAGMEWR